MAALLSALRPSWPASLAEGRGQSGAAALPGKVWVRVRASPAPALHTAGSMRWAEPGIMDTPRDEFLGVGAGFLRGAAGSPTDVHSSFLQCLDHPLDGLVLLVKDADGQDATQVR